MLGLVGDGGREVGDVDFLEVIEVDFSFRSCHLVVGNLSKTSRVADRML
jgi:hypothetical protein